MPRLEITPNELFKGILELPNRSTNHDIKEVSKEPIVRILYNQILSFSKEELESITDRFDKEDCLYNTLLKRGCGNPFLFGAIIEKRVSSHLYSNYTNWILDNIKEIGLNEADLLTTLEFTNINKDSKENHYRIQNPLLSIIRYLKDNDELINAFFDEYLIKKENFKMVAEYIINYLQYNEKDRYVDLMLAKLTDYGVKIDKININTELNQGIGKEYELLFVRPEEVTHIKRLLEAGFRFNEDKYNNHGRSLYTTILDSGIANLVKVVLPTLKNIPIGDKIDYNRDIVEKYKSKPQYDEIKAIFEYSILNNKVLNNNKEVKKIKI